MIKFDKFKVNGVQLQPNFKSTSHNKKFSKDPALLYAIISVTFQTDDATPRIE